MVTDVSVALVRPQLDGWYRKREQLTELFSPPVGLIFIKEAIKRLVPDVNVKIYDEMNWPENKSFPKIKADIVGVSSLYSMQESSIARLEQPKKDGAITFIGGHHVTHLAENLLRNNASVDYAIVGDGEKAMALFVHYLSKMPKEKIPLDKIPNIVWRRGNEIIANPVENYPLDIIYDLEGILGSEYPVENAMPVLSHRGCFNARESKAICEYCSENHHLVTMNHDLFWKQVKLLNESYDVNYIWDTGDMMTFRDFPQQILNSRPDNLKDMNMRFYLTPNWLNKDNIETIINLNPKWMYVGCESIIDEQMKNAGKRYRRTHVENALNLLEPYILDGKASIQLPLMFGFPGETLETAKQKYEFAKKVTERFKESVMILSTFEIPLPGTRIFNEIREIPEARKAYPGDLFTNTVFDYSELVRLHLKHRTKIDFESLREIVSDTRELVKSGIRTAFYIEDE